MAKVRPKKHLGQHFLNNSVIAQKIVDSLTVHNNYRTLIEIGPGTGVLTAMLVNDDRYDLVAMDVDKESLDYLKEEFPDNQDSFLYQDFLKFSLGSIPESVGIIGNFPYNISSQIFFHILEQVDKVEEVVCMLQKEVAERIAAPPGSKTYGILSVLLQAYYQVEYLFSVKASNFIPPPKVMSGVIRLRRLQDAELKCDKKLFFRVVKAGFQKRRKTLRNALKHLNLPPLEGYDEIFLKRAEQLSVEQFVQLTLDLETAWKK